MSQSSATPQRAPTSAPPASSSTTTTTARALGSGGLGLFSQRPAAAVGAPTTATTTGVAAKPATDFKPASSAMPARRPESAVAAIHAGAKAPAPQQQQQQQRSTAVAAQQQPAKPVAPPTPMTTAPITATTTTTKPATTAAAAAAPKEANKSEKAMGSVLDDIIGGTDSHDGYDDDLFGDGDTMTASQFTNALSDSRVTATPPRSTQPLPTAKIVTPTKSAAPAPPKIDYMEEVVEEESSRTTPKPAAVVDAQPNVGKALPIDTVLSSAVKAMAPFKKQQQQQKEALDESQEMAMLDDIQDDSPPSSSAKKPTSATPVAKAVVDKKKSDADAAMPDATEKAEDAPKAAVAAVAADTASTASAAAAEASPAKGKKAAKPKTTTTAAATGGTPTKAKPAIRPEKVMLGNMVFDKADWEFRFALYDGAVWASLQDVASFVGLGSFSHLMKYADEMGMTKKYFHIGKQRAASLKLDDTLALFEKHTKASKRKNIMHALRELFEKISLAAKRSAPKVAGVAVVGGAGAAAAAESEEPSKRQRVEQSSALPATGGGKSTEDAVVTPAVVMDDADRGDANDDDDDMPPSTQVPRSVPTLPSIARDEESSNDDSKDQTSSSNAATTATTGAKKQTKKDDGGDDHGKSQAEAGDEQDATTTAKGAKKKAAAPAKARKNAARGASTSARSRGSARGSSGRGRGGKAVTAAQRRASKANAQEDTEVSDEDDDNNNNNNDDDDEDNGNKRFEPHISASIKRRAEEMATSPAQYSDTISSMSSFVASAWRKLSPDRRTTCAEQITRWFIETQQAMGIS